MDTGKGKFEMSKQSDLANEQQIREAMEVMEQKHPVHGGWFHEGEIIEIRGSRFRVKSVKPTELRLKLLPKGK